MLRDATDDDLDAMLRWRNQEVNRAVSVNQHEISRDEHRAWWERASGDRGRRVLIFEADGRGIGAVSFSGLALDDSPRTGEWGFYLDHATLTREGTALTAWMKVMGEAIDYAFDTLGLDVLTGEVLPHNEAVRLMNRRFRFVEGEPRVRRTAAGEVTVIPISLRREDRRKPSRGKEAG